MNGVLEEMVEEFQALDEMSDEEEDEDEDEDDEEEYLDGEEGLEELEEESEYELALNPEEEGALLEQLQGGEVDDDDDDGNDDEEEGSSEDDLEMQSAEAGEGPAGAGEGQDAEHTTTIDLNELLAMLSAQEEDDDDDYYPYGARARRPRPGELWTKCEEPIEDGQELARSGAFSRPTARSFNPDLRSAFHPSCNLASKVHARNAARKPVTKSDLSRHVPNTNGTEVAKYPARVYCGQYSDDSSFFYTCDQDFKVHIYDTSVAPQKYARAVTSTGGGGGGGWRGRTYEETHETSLKVIKTINGRAGQWTITDAHLSPNNAWMIYSSITPFVYLVPTRVDEQQSGSQSDKQVLLDFSGGDDDAGVRYRRDGIWSIRFSGDSREIVAGANQGSISVFDIEARKRVLRIQAHYDDVNAVAFADAGSSNVLISGSDDSFVKVWDRRSLSGGKPAGVLPGHTEGITYVSPKGDGRYCISNGKDQSVKLWDLRHMSSSSEFDSDPVSNYDVGVNNWDYRNMTYKKPRHQRRPNDRSIMTYRGHSVLHTLIRCHFSPSATTGQQYIYSGSADGRIHIWSLDGRVVQVLDRNLSVPMYRSTHSVRGEGPLAADPSEPVLGQSELQERRQTSAGRHQSHGMGWGSSGSGSTVRDVSWHSSEPSLMSTSWEPSGGSIAKHEWKAFGTNGLGFEDAVEKTRLEAMRE
ncbi:WD40 repeat-containing protein [Ceraceosorus bombacis]|uniref:WD40 repeat-containing protein n=1 Tax=Ceraceosorus bombacis TaxID=401625 RepID=A0A0P1BJF2_9BASI|nr:WD40 repeat-containing protein [Ceraceosorus bombacis]